MFACFLNNFKCAFYLEYTSLYCILYFQNVLMDHHNNNNENPKKYHKLNNVSCGVYTLNFSRHR